VVAAITEIGPTLRLRSAGGAGTDHPVLAAFPEGRYLKFLFFDKP
jgi:23S rRNA G2069 N7-methylase RlmK/C1962 C5-methylase RlmI